MRMLMTMATLASLTLSGLAAHDDRGGTVHRIDHATRQIDKFGVGRDGFTAGNPELQVPATVVPDTWLDSVQEELANAVEDGGAALDPGSNRQLADRLVVLQQLLPATYTRYLPLTSFAPLKPYPAAGAGWSYARVPPSLTAHASEDDLHRILPLPAGTRLTRVDARVSSGVTLRVYPITIATDGASTAGTAVFAQRAEAGIGNVGVDCDITVSELTVAMVELTASADYVAGANYGNIVWVRITATGVPTEL